MQSVIAVKIGALKSLMEQEGVIRAVQDVAQFVAKVRGILGGQIFDVRGDMILAATDQVQNAMALSDRLRHLHPATTIVIGYGDLYRTANGIYWGPEIEEVIRMITCQANPGEILLTSSARVQR